MLINENIAAIATAQGTGGIAIIRICGDDAITIARKYTRTEKIIKSKYNMLFLEKIYIDDSLFDEVLITKFEKGRSFSGEQTVELHCHGGAFLTNKLLKHMISNHDIRLAMPGEFSKLAFLNGKMSLNKAQGIMDLINAHNDITQKMATRSLTGDNISSLKAVYDDLIDSITQISVTIDYPEYSDIKIESYKELNEKITKCKISIDNLLYDSKRGQIFKDGINTAIVGRPNVGKSTLLNLLANQQKAIVTDIAGTTRDVIEVDVLIGNIKLNLADTAGIRQSEDLVEQMGIEKSFKLIEDSSFVIFITDSTKELNNIDEKIYSKLSHKNYIVLNNKVEVGEYKHFSESLDVSLSDASSLNIIEDAIMEKFNLSNFDADNTSFINSQEHILLLEEVSETFIDIIDNLNCAEPLDLIEIDLKDVIYLIGDILGIEAKNDIINEMFGRFCLGK